MGRCTKSSVNYITLPGDSQNPELWEWIRRDAMHYVLILELSNLMRYDYGLYKIDAQGIDTLAWATKQTTDEVREQLTELVEIGYLDADAHFCDVAWSGEYADTAGRQITGSPDKRKTWQRRPTYDELTTGKQDPPPRRWKNGHPIIEGPETAEKTEPIETKTEETTLKNENNTPRYIRPAFDDEEETTESADPIVIYADTDGHTLAVQDGNAYDRCLRIFGGNTEEMLDTAADIVDYHAGKQTKYLLDPHNDKWDPAFALKALRSWHKRRQGQAVMA